MGHPRITLRTPELFFAGDSDPGFHLVEIFGQGAAAGGGQAVFGAGDASFKKFQAGNVLRLFELAGVDAEVSVGGFEHALEIVEAERIVGGEGADDAETNALMNEAIEFGEFGRAGRGVAGLFGIVIAGFFTRAIAQLGMQRGLGGLARIGQGSSHRASNLRACGR